MIVTASGAGYVIDVEELSLSCLGCNEVSSAVNTVRRFFGHATLAACAFNEDKSVPGCDEAAQKIKQLQGPERASPWYGVSVRIRNRLVGIYVTSLHAREVAT